MHGDIENMAIEIGQVETDDERSSVFSLRILVFVNEQLVPIEEELDGYDVTATHFLVRVRTSTHDRRWLIIATARLVDKGDGVGKVGRVAVMAEYRGLGFGACLMRFIENHARVRGYRRLELEAQRHDIPFYEKLGYIAEGRIFLDANIEHRYMSLRLTRKSAPDNAAAVREDGGQDLSKELQWGHHPDQSP
jgi:predicted GNAT family N-acyltransferase